MIMLVAVLTLAPTLTFAQKEVINWHVYHRPPSSIKTGQLAGQGFIDKITQQLIAAMPDYAHAQPLSSSKRTIHAMREGSRVCHPVYLKNQERLNYAYFSRPSVIAPSIRLVGLTLPVEIEQSKVDLDKLNKNANFGILRGRVHHVLVDSFIDKTPVDYKITLATDKTTELFKLVATGKIDYTFSYPIEVNYFNQSNSAQQLKIWHIDGVDPYVLGYVACAKSEWGRKVIDHVNHALKGVIKTEAYFHALTSWWPQESLRPEFIEFYESQFLSAHQ